MNEYDSVDIRTNVATSKPPYAIPWGRIGHLLWRNPGTQLADCIEALLGFAASRLVALLQGFREFRFAYRYSLDLDFDDITEPKRQERLLRAAGFEP